jgi:hypothetical protein
MSSKLKELVKNLRRLETAFKDMNAAVKSAEAQLAELERALEECLLVRRLAVFGDPNPVLQQGDLELVIHYYSQAVYRTERIAREALARLRAARSGGGEEGFTPDIPGN